MRKHKLAGILNTALIVLLLIILACTFFVYSVSFRGGEYEKFGKDDFKKLASESSKYSYLRYFDLSYTMPYFIGVNLPEQNYNAGFSLGSDSVAAAYAHISRYLGVMLSGDATNVSLGKAEGDETLENIISGEYVCVSWYGCLPLSVLRCFLSPENLYAEMPGYAREIYITRDGSYINMLVSDTEGGYRMMRLEDGRFSDMTNIFDALSYNDIVNVCSYTFASGYGADGNLTENGFYEKISGSTVIFSDSPLMVMVNSLTLTSASDMFYGEENRGNTETLLKLFSVSPEKALTYTDAKGNVSYYEEKRKLSITKGGTLEYSAADGSGLPLYEVLDYVYEDSETDVYDCVSAALKLRSEIMSLVAGYGDALLDDCVLTDIYMSSDTVTVRFGYTYKNLPVTFDSKHVGVEIRVSGGLVTYASVKLAVCEGYDYAVTSGSAEIWAIRRYLDYGEEICDVLPSVDYTEIPGKSYFSWKLRPAGSASER